MYGISDMLRWLPRLSIMQLQHCGPGANTEAWSRKDDNCLTQDFKVETFLELGDSQADLFTLSTGPNWGCGVQGAGWGRIKLPGCRAINQWLEAYSKASVELLYRCDCCC